MKMQILDHPTAIQIWMNIYSRKTLFDSVEQECRFFYECEIDLFLCYELMWIDWMYFNFRLQRKIIFKSSV